MPSLVDIPYLSAYQQATQPVDVLSNVAKGFAFGDEMPWSVRRQRKEAIENHQLWMKQQQFQADMQDRARLNQIQEMLLPYKIQQAQRLANPYGGAVTTGGGSFQTYLDEIDAPTATEPVILPDEAPPLSPYGTQMSEIPTQLAPAPAAPSYDDLGLPLN